MHVVATNLCVWIRILVRECLKEVTRYQAKAYTEGYRILGEFSPPPLLSRLIPSDALNLFPSPKTQAPKILLYTSLSFSDTVIAKI